jgi:Fic/DOC family
MTPTKKNFAFLFHESNLIEGFNSPAFDGRQLVAWKYLLKVPYLELNIGHILKVQKLVTLLQRDLQPGWRGHFRKIDVYIGGHPALMPHRIEEAMARWVDSYPDMDPVKAHVLFEKVHPFVDGNGRTGRLLLWWMQMHRKELLSKITYEGRQGYYAWFRA